MQRGVMGAVRQCGRRPRHDVISVSCTLRSSATLAVVLVATLHLLLPPCSAKQGNVDVCYYAVLYDATYMPYVSYT